MLGRLLQWVERVAIERPRQVLAMALAVTVVALLLGSGIELRTSRAELVAENDVEQLRWERLHEEFAGPEPLIIALEPAAGPVDVQALQSAADSLATALEQRPEIDYVFYHLEMDWLLDHALHLAPPLQLTRAADQLEGLLGEGDTITLSDFAAFNEQIASRIESALATGAVLPSSGASDEASRLADILRAQQAFFDDPADFVQRHSGSILELAGMVGDSAITADGYLSTHDQRMIFLIASPTDADAELVKQQRLVNVMREVCDNVLAGSGVRYALTGPAAMTVEEMASIRRDTRITSGIAILGVGVLAMLAFRPRRHALIGLAVLAMGVAWSIGAVRLELGYLNMITTALIPILVGIGIDFAVHPISQYEIERHETRDRKAAVQAASRKTSKAVVVSALTTAAAFFCFGFMEFRGYAELGMVAGGGVLLCLLAALFVLPALLMLRGAVASTRLAAVDRLWTRVANLILRQPPAVVAVALLTTVVAVWAGAAVPLDTSLLELMPPGSESLKYLRIVGEESAISAYVNIVATDDLQQLRDWERQAQRFDSIERFESVLQFLPESPEATAAAVERVDRLLDRVEVVETGWSGRARLADGLERLELALEDATEAAFVTGLGDLVAPLEAARTHAAHTRERITAAGADEESAWAAAQDRMRQRVRELLRRLQASAAVPPPSVATLPEDLRTRFLTTRGRYLGFIHPTQSIFDREAADRFNAASLAISPEAIGFPILFAAHSRQITSGFSLTFAVGALLVLLILGLDLRSVSQTLLALVPVMLGIVWMLGLMRLFGLPFNLANLVAVPLVLGVGIDNGVHMIHRCKLEGHAGMTTALAHTGRAILVASLTTMLGFGSLSFAAHRGMASLGVLLFLGVGASMVAALVVLPNLLVVLGVARARG